MEIIDIITGLEVFYIEYYWDGREGYTYSSGFYNEDETICPDEITDLVYYITDKLGELAEYDKDNTLFNILAKKMNGDIYNCYYDACVWFRGKPENREFIENLISKIPDNKEALHRSHFLIAHFDGDGAENEFLQNHINMSDFRGIAIRKAMSNKEYERVIELTETAKEYFDLHEYDMKGWKKIALGACRELRDVAGMKKYMIQFVVGGEFSYIEQLKEICTNEEWKKILSDIIDKIKKKSQFDYERILVKEEQFDELFSVCQKFKFKILEYYPYFAKNNKEAAQKLFYSEAVREASILHDRSGYNKLCQKILNFGKVYGQDKAQEIIDVLKANHKRQRAFIDELMHIES